MYFQTVLHGGIYRSLVVGRLLVGKLALIEPGELWLVTIVRGNV